MGEAEVFKDSARVSSRADRISSHVPSGAFGVCPKAGKERCRLPEVLQLEPGQGADVSVPKRLGESLSVQVCCFVWLLSLYLQRGKGDLDSKVLPCSREKGKRHLSVIRGLQDAEVRDLPALHFPSGLDSPQQVFQQQRRAPASAPRSHTVPSPTACRGAGVGDLLGRFRAKNQKKRQRRTGENRYIRSSRSLAVATG